MVTYETVAWLIAAAFGAGILITSFLIGLSIDWSGKTDSFPNS